LGLIKMTTVVSRKRGADVLSSEPDEQGSAKRLKTEGTDGTTAEKTGALFTNNFANGISVGEKSIQVNVQTSMHRTGPVLPFDPRTLGNLTGPLFDTSASDPGQSVEDLQNASQVAPVSTSAARTHDLGQNLLSPRATSSEMEESMSLAPVLAPVAQSDEPDHEELGLEQLLKEQFQEAVASFEKCVAAANSTKRTAKALNHLGIAHLGKLGLALHENEYDFEEFQGMAQFDYGAAIESFKKALETRYDFDASFRNRVQFNLAVTYFCRKEEGDYQRAVALLIEGLKDVDEDAPLMMSIEDRFFCAKMSWFAGTLLDDFHSAIAYYNLGLVCQRQQLGVGRQTFGDPYQGNLFALIHLSRAIAFKENGHAQLAKESLDQVVALESELSNQSIPARAYCELGLLNEMTGGEVDKSIEYYDHGLTCGFDDPHLEATLHYNRARLFTDVKRDFSLAIQVCETALKLDVVDASLLGEIYFLLLKNYVQRRQGNDLHSAIDHGRMALELDLENSMLLKFLVALGEINMLVDDHNRAGEHFYEAANIEGLETHARVEYLIKSAALFAKAEEFEQALESAQKANELNVDKLKKIQLHLFLGQIYNVLADKTEDQGKRDELLDAGKKILEEGLKLKETLEKEQARKQEA
jgi:tetratricopeptide (TPR) repeat protein